MKSRIPVIACSAAAFVLLAGGLTRVSAQSLADVARQEEARRKDTKEPAKVYTNKDLRGGATAAVPAPATEAAAPATPAAADGDKAAPAAGAAPAAPPKDGAVVKDQKYWAKRMADLRTALERDQTYAGAMQVKVDALTRDFTARDDPSQRGQIGAERQKSLAELDRLKAAIVTDKKAIADLEDEARRASVPAGWLR